MSDVKRQITQGINWLEWLLDNFDSIWKIIYLVQDNPEFFGVDVGGSTLEAAANTLERLIEESNNG